MPIEHYHCPDECENPQPIHALDGKHYCGRCWFKFGEIVEVVLCTPETCDEGAPA